MLYALNKQIKGAAKRAALLMTCADTSPKEAEPIRLHYRTLMDYLGWTSVGEVVGAGSVDGRQRPTHGLSAAGLSAGQELVIIYQQSE